MAKLKLTGKQLRNIGYPEGPVISIAMNIMEKSFRHLPEADALEILSSILQSPNQYAHDGVLGKIAEALLPKPKVGGDEIPLMPKGIEFNVFGASGIEQGAMQQMNTAVKVPIAVAGALMPDAHQGYGLPIGGVLATDNAVIPYGVGVDIGCRMCLSVFDIDPKELTAREQYFTRELNEATLFGSGSMFDKPFDHEIMERKEFDELGLLKGLQTRAWKQLGSSGSGNHFVEFGIVEISEQDQVLNIPAGKYVGLLSHSGSRALGANIANHFTKVAKEKRRLPSEASNLAWLDLNEQEGMEYWLAMNLAGDYASACHHVIHDKIARQLGRRPLKMVENHHNFAWKEQWEGKEVIVHRKGATPAGKDVLGIIPGSMTAPGFIVKGKGEMASVNSAAHGAGRQMSRTVALKSITHNALNDMLAKHGVKLLGGGLDEAPFAYKNIFEVMNAQKQLVDTVGLFYPKIVKMDGAMPKQWKKKNRDFQESGDLMGE
ncbi:RtcB family protein [Flavisolibacter tropicus]|uniref:3'-phosphate/5'-hydroxy nucleic acid ligase n=1 Tax=Flavisolibacter tropicus TaxID=1492898 RepID=A0A172TZE0_9BACT|nr:RtcB family protein [Flavisolibacter tropicus]ANE52430.1 RNA 2',3'-cyclic phosphate--5'-hydroxyl ligase [Flavisolibacter tropicus]